MKKLGFLLLGVILTLTLVACGPKTSITADLLNIEVDQTSIMFDVELSDPESEITGSIIVYLYDENGLRNQKTLDDETDYIGIYFYGLETVTDFTVKVVVTVGRDAVTVETYEFTTLTADEITINTVEEFMAMSDNKNGNYVLGQDIDFTGETFVSPFNTSTIAFGGSFDGNGYTLSNITFSEVSMYTGVFGYVSSGVIENVTFDNVHIGTVENPLVMATSSRVGIVTGYATSVTARVENVTVQNSTIVFESNSTIQAYVGIVSGEYKGVVQTVELIDNFIQLTETTYGNVKIGGAVALTGEYTDINQVYSSTDIEFIMAGETLRDEDVSHMIGGIVAQQVTGASISEIVNEGDIDVTMDYNTLEDTVQGNYVLYVGGLVGKANDVLSIGFYSGNITVDHEAGVYETEVSKQFRIGGLVGYYENRLESTDLLNMGATITVNVSPDVYLDASQVFGFNRFEIVGNIGLFGTEHLMINMFSEVDNDSVTVYDSIVEYYESEWIETYLVG